MPAVPTRNRTEGSAAKETLRALAPRCAGVASRTTIQLRKKED
jgi:hypothetical protein